MTYPRIAGFTGLAAVACLVFSAPAWSASVQLTTRNKAPLGTYLTDAAGRTVYMFTADKPNQSNCTGACTGPWPPVLTTGAPEAGNGVEASGLGTIKRGNEMQVTFQGKPLYYFANDKGAGATSGEGINHFGGSWYVVSPDGKGILPDGKPIPAG